MFRLPFIILFLFLSFNVLAKDATSNLQSKSDSALNADHIRAQTLKFMACTGQEFNRFQISTLMATLETIPMVSAFTAVEELEKGQDDFRGVYPLVNGLLGDIIGNVVMDGVIGPIRWGVDWIGDGQTDEFVFFRSFKNHFYNSTKRTSKKLKNKYITNQKSACGKYRKQVSAIETEIERRIMLALDSTDDDREAKNIALSDDDILEERVVIQE